ncbi:unnamed protein product, partial [Ilex paraguariensis]
SWEPGARPPTPSIGDSGQKTGKDEAACCDSLRLDRKKWLWMQDSSLLSTHSTVYEVEWAPVHGYIKP